MAEQTADLNSTVLTEYLRWLHGQRNLATYTLRNYHNDVADYLHYLTENASLSLAEADRSTLRGYLYRQMAMGIASGSIRRKVSALRSFYTFLTQTGRAGHNLLGDRRAPNRVRGPRRERTLPSFLSEEEVNRLISAPDGPQPAAVRDRAILELLYAAGLRVSELVGLNVDDIDLKERRIFVFGKGSKERVVLIGAPARRALERYMTDARPQLLLNPEQQALFLNRHGQRLSVRAVQIMVRRYAAKAGLDQRVYPHLLRHTFATHMADNNADIRIVQTLLGHARADTTQIYAHVTQARLRETYDAAFYNQLRHEKGDEDD